MPLNNQFTTMGKPKTPAGEAGGRTCPSYKKRGHLLHPRNFLFPNHHALLLRSSTRSFCDPVLHSLSCNKTNQVSEGSSSSCLPEPHIYPGPRPYPPSFLLPTTILTVSSNISPCSFSAKTFLPTSFAIQKNCKCHLPSCPFHQTHQTS